MRRPDYFVTPEYVLHVASQQRWNKPSGQDWNGIAQAMKLAEPGETIGFVGSHDAVEIGGWNHWDPSTVFWASGPVHDLKIYGMNTSAKLIGSTYFSGEFGTPYNIEFSNYTHIVNNMRCILTSMYYGPFMGLKFNNIKFDVSPENFPGGLQANDWIFRFHGRAQFQINNCEQLHPNQMHFVYADNIAGDSSVTNCKANGNGRTMVQIVNRQSQPCSAGSVLVDRCLSIGAGHLDGASAFTCSGHLGGSVTFRNCHTQGALAGSLTAWSETGLHPSHLNAEGKAIDHLIVENCSFQSTQADRDAIAISSCSKARVGRLAVASNQNGLRLNHHQGQDNLDFAFTVPNPSQMRWAVPHKVVRGHDYQSTVVLTDPEIDSLYQPNLED